MKKRQIVKKILLEKDKKKSKIHTKKWERCFDKVSKEKGDESAAAICTSSIGYEGSIYSKHRRKEESNNPKMKKGDLVEYINSKKLLLNEQEPHLIREMDRGDFGIVVRWLEKLRESGVINMFGCAPMLNWTRDDMERWLYGQRQDVETLENRIEDLEYDLESEGEDSGMYESELEMVKKQLETINYLLDNKQAVRDVLIRTALKRIDNTDGNHELKNVQRVFDKLSKEVWRMWTYVVYGQIG